MNREWIDLACLLVEDEKIQAQASAAILEAAGFKVSVIAYYGSDAIEAYRSRHFDLVVIDLVLPDLDGCDVIQIMRTHADHTATIIALTGSNDPDTMARAMDSGADDIYAKILGAQVLRAKFSRIALAMADARRDKQIVAKIEHRLDDTVAHLNTCAAEKQQELDALKELIKAPPLLTEEQIEAIADRAAKKAVAEAAEHAAELAMQIMQRNMQLSVGRFVLTRGAIVVGMVVIGLFGWLAGRGLIKI